jgi:triacylglycerol lipase
MTGLFVLLICSALILLDFKKLIHFTSGIPMLVLMLALPHITAGWYGLLSYDKASGGSTLSLVMDGAGLTVLYLYAFFRFHLCTFRKNKIGTLRVRILFGGQLLIRAGMWGMVLQSVFYLFFFKMLIAASPVHFPSPLLWADFAVCLSFIGGILFNGCVRILLTCRRLGIARRLVVSFFLWFPLINLFVMHYICRKAVEEYDHECYRFTARAERAGSRVCATQYPLIMVHGIGFRDLRFFNYWGRIPKELTNNGAVVYYGHQEAWGTIEDNAQCLREKIEDVLRENRCDKVNIIAHSKGGLDSRYMISRLEMGGKVASLTTISTPHYGSPLINVFNRLPDSIYRFIASQYDRAFRKVGDKNPDCYRASKQLAPSFCAEFNRTVPDMPGVYYQSFTSVMKGMRSDPLLSLPYFVMSIISGKNNDGLVDEKSAVWGTFKGTVRNKYKRGISHGDIIDLKREDYKGFDVLEHYIKIVSELKTMGF